MFFMVIIIIIIITIIIVTITTMISNTNEIWKITIQLKLREAMHINWEKPNLNQQVRHVNLTLAL